MKIVCISDIHNYHKKIDMPEGDVVVCTGDVSSRGFKHELQNFIKWYGNLPYKRKVLVCGNHDVGAEKDFPKEFKIWCRDAGIDYLENSEVVIDGLKFYGSPVTPRFGYGWAWNVDRDRIGVYWDNIPEDTDILLTHGPPYSILDYTFYGQENVGCEALLERVFEVRPKLHVFGHIHEEYGKKIVDGIRFVNASICTLAYNPDNKPIVVEIK